MSENQDQSKNSYHQVNTTYMPEEVPVVKLSVSSSTSGVVLQGPTNLTFTESTASPYVSGSITRPEQVKTDERASLAQGLISSSEAHNFRQSSSGTFGVPLGNTLPVPNTGSQPDPYAEYPYYNVRRYRGYFDVDTKDVLWRVGNSMLGAARPTFLETTMRHPDLYGPFWAATTLVFLTAVVGNYASYLQFQREASSYAEEDGTASHKQWFNDYTKLVTSAAVFYGYIFIVGLGLFFTIKWFNGQLRLVNIFCIYGYSLTIFTPVAILCVIPVAALQWTLIMAATLMSGVSLAMNLRATMDVAAPKRVLAITATVLAIHIGLGVALKCYFFSY